MWVQFWSLVTLLGSPYLWAGIAAGLFVVYIFIRHARIATVKQKALKRFLLLFIPTLVLTFLIVSSLKPIIGIERPCMPCPGVGCNPYCPLDASFPSGHAATIFAAFTCLFAVIKGRKSLLLFIIPIIVALSRVALMVHTWPDVIVGALIGIAVPFVIFQYDMWVFGEFR